MEEKINCKIDWSMASDEELETVYDAAYEYNARMSELGDQLSCRLNLGGRSVKLNELRDVLCRPSYDIIRSIWAEVRKRKPE